MRTLLAVMFFSTTAFACTPVSIPKLTNKQMEWLTNTGLKKYDICRASKDSPAQYEIKFSNEPWSLEYQQPTATVHASGVENIEAKAYETKTWNYDIIYTYVFRTDDKDAPPIYAKSRSGAWHYNADRLALEDALKFIYKQK